MLRKQDHISHKDRHGRNHNRHSFVRSVAKDNESSKTQLKKISVLRKILCVICEKTTDSIFTTNYLTPLSPPLSGLSSYHHALSHPPPFDKKAVRLF